MSNHTLEKQLDLVINLLESLPKCICNEWEKRHEINKEQRVQEIQSQMEFYSNNINKINEFMCDFKTKAMDNNNRSVESV